MRLARNIASVPASLAESAIVPQGYGSYALLLLNRILNLPYSAKLLRLAAGVVWFSLFVAGLFALAGAGLVATGRQWFVSLYFAVNLALIVITPWQSQFWRYLAPVAPLTLVFLFLTLAAIRQWLRRQT